MILKILVVEDEKDILQQIEQLFELDPRIKILKVTSGEKAMEIINNEKPHVILLDIKLGNYPYMDGMNVLEKLRKFDKKTEVIIMTAIRDESFVEGAKKLGVRAYLKKPFSIELLREEVEKILQEKGLS